jgi:hypothetical protein
MQGRGTFHQRMPRGRASMQVRRPLSAEDAEKHLEEIAELRRQIEARTRLVTAAQVSHSPLQAPSCKIWAK